jgi:hypothetical protein
VALWQDDKLPPDPVTSAKRQLIGAWVTNSKGIPIAGRQVTFTGTGLTSVGPATVITDTEGYATVVVQSDGSANATVAASIPGGGYRQSVECAVRF